MSAVTARDSVLRFSARPGLMSFLPIGRRPRRSEIPAQENTRIRSPATISSCCAAGVATTPTAGGQGQAAGQTAGQTRSAHGTVGTQAAAGGLIRQQQPQTQGGASATSPGGTQVGAATGGIMGVASKSKEESIRIYQRTHAPQRVAVRVCREVQQAGQALQTLQIRAAGGNGRGGPQDGGIRRWPGTEPGECADGFLGLRRGGRGFQRGGDGRGNFPPGNGNPPFGRGAPPSGPAPTQPVRVVDAHLFLVHKSGQTPLRPRSDPSQISDARSWKVRRTSCISSEVPVPHTRFVSRMK